MYVALFSVALFIAMCSDGDLRNRLTVVLKGTVVVLTVVLIRSIVLYWLRPL